MSVVVYTRNVDPADGTSSVVVRRGSLGEPTLTLNMGEAADLTIEEIVYWSQRIVLEPPSIGAGGGLSYVSLQEEGTTVSQRSTINFIGSGVTVTDDAGSNRANVNIAADLNSAVVLAPTTSSRNLVQPTTASVVPLVLKNRSSQTASLQQWQDSAGAVMAEVTPTGVFRQGNQNVVLDNDARLTNSRTPTGAAGGVLSGTYPNPGFAEDMATHNELSTVQSSAVMVTPATTARNTVQPLGASVTPLILKGWPSQTASLQQWQNSDGTVLAQVSSTGSISQGGQAVVLTNDSRLTNSRNPTGAAGGVLSGTYPNPGFAADMATQAELDAHVNHASHTNERVPVDGSVTNAKVATNAAIAYSKLNLTGSVTAADLTFDPATQVELDTIVAAAPVLAPGSSSRNVIQPTGSGFIPLTVRGAASQSVDLTQWQNSSSTVLASVNNAGAGRFTKLGIAADAPAYTNVYIGPTQGDFGSSEFYFIQAFPNWQPTNDLSKSIYGIDFGLNVYDNLATGNITGQQVGGRFRLIPRNSARVISNATGARFGLDHVGSGGTFANISNAKAAETTFAIGGGTATDARMLHINSPTGAGSITDLYGLYVSNMAKGSNQNYSIYTAGGQTRHDAGAATVVPLVIRGAAAQSSNLQEWQSSAPTALASITSAGVVHAASGLRVGSTATSGYVLTSDSSGNATWQSPPAPDLSSTVVLAPSSSTRNVIQPTDPGVRPFIIRGAASQSVDLQRWEDSAGFDMASVSATGIVQASMFKALGGFAPTTFGDVGAIRFLGQNANILAGFEQESFFSTDTNDYNAITARVTARQHTGVTHTGKNIAARHAFSQSNFDNEYGTVTNFYGSYSEAAINGGTLVNRYGSYILNPTGAGSLTNNYGLYIENQNKGTAVNRAIHTAGGEVRHESGAAGVIPLVLRTASGQTANAIESRDSSDVVKFSISPVGGPGFYGVTPPAQPAARTLSNWTIGSNANRSINRNSYTLDHIFDFVMTMAYDLQQTGLFA